MSKRRKIKGQARRVWTCECGSTWMLRPLKHPDKLVVKGAGCVPGSLTDEQRYVRCASCWDSYQFVPRIAVLKNKKIKTQRVCEHVTLLIAEGDDLVVRGRGHPYGSPTTHVRCSVCDARRRIAPDVSFSSSSGRSQDA